MDLKKFSQEIAKIMPQIWVDIVKRQPNELTKGKITFPQMIIINILLHKKEYKMSEIAHILGTTMSAVTGLTDRLIKAGLIERTRSIDDRRVVNIRLTKRGRNTSRKIQRQRLKMIETLFSNINQKERTQYLRILKKLQRNIKIRRGHG